jgi:hypothetical protein
MDQQLDELELRRGRRIGSEALDEDRGALGEGGGEALGDVRPAQPEIVPPGLDRGCRVALQKGEVEGQRPGRERGSGILACSGDQRRRGRQRVLSAERSEIDRRRGGAQPDLVPLAGFVAGGGEARHLRQEGFAAAGFMEDPRPQLAARAAVVAGGEGSLHLGKGAPGIGIDEPGDPAELAMGLRPVRGARGAIGGDPPVDGLGLRHLVLAIGLHGAADRLGDGIAAGGDKEQRQTQYRPHDRLPLRHSGSGPG